MGHTRVVVEVAGAQPYVQMRDVWTFEDLQELELEDWRRYEIVDGALVVSPPAGNAHELVGADLRAAIWPRLPPGFVVIGPVGVTFGRSYLIPDLAVVRRSRARDPQRFEPADFDVVIEIVSPGSVTTDRITKPAQYAAAGIAAYWRVETDPVSITVYELPPGASTYVEVGTWAAGETARIVTPFEIDIEIDRLG